MAEERNRKLLEFAGFRRTQEMDLAPSRDYWISPEGEMYHPSALPKFSLSLDACLKWLVPLIPNLIGIECYPIIVEGLDTGNGYWWTIYTGTTPYRWLWDVFEGPALAEAIEQLMVKEE